MKTTVLPVRVTDYADSVPTARIPLFVGTQAVCSAQLCSAIAQATRPRTARVQHSGVRICPEFTRGAACSDRAHPVKSSP